MTDVVLIRVNCKSRQEAEYIGAASVKAKLAACANIEGPITSIYDWEGKLESDEEYLLWLKTRTAFWLDAERLILELHSFDTPAILAIPCQHANARYEAWLHTNTGKL